MAEEENAGGMTTVALFSVKQARRVAAAGLIVGVLAAAGLVWLGLDDGGSEGMPAPALVGFLAAGAGGVLLVCAGLGLLAGEAVAVVSVRRDEFGALSTLNADQLKALKDALKSLTAARATIFAGVFLLSVTVLAAAATAGSESPDPTPTPTVTTPAPTSTPMATSTG